MKRNHSFSTTPYSHCFLDEEWIVGCLDGYTPWRVLFRGNRFWCKNLLGHRFCMFLCILAFSCVPSQSNGYLDDVGGYEEAFVCTINDSNDTPWVGACKFLLTGGRLWVLSNLLVPESGRFVHGASDSATSHVYGTKHKNKWQVTNMQLMNKLNCLLDCWIVPNANWKGKGKMERETGDERIVGKTSGRLIVATPLTWGNFLFRF